MDWEYLKDGGGESFFKKLPRSGGGANLGSFWFSFIFSHNCSALDHSATAPPSQHFSYYHARIAMNVMGVLMKVMVINWERPTNFKAVQCRFTKPVVTRCQTSLWFFFPWIICWLSYSLNKYSVFYSVIWDPADRRFNFLNAIFAARHDWVTMKLQSSSNKGLKWSSRFFNSGVKIHQLL